MAKTCPARMIREATPSTRFPAVPGNGAGSDTPVCPGIRWRAGVGQVGKLVDHLDPPGPVWLQISHWEGLVWRFRGS